MDKLSNNQLSEDTIQIQHKFNAFEFIVNQLFF